MRIAQTALFKGAKIAARYFRFKQRTPINAEISSLMSADREQRLSLSKCERCRSGHR
jgi:hypothetical protein